jgi:hypothetical protein
MTTIKTQLTTGARNRKGTAFPRAKAEPQAYGLVRQGQHRPCPRPGGGEAPAKGRAGARTEALGLRPGQGGNDGARQGQWPLPPQPRTIRRATP